MHAESDDKGISIWIDVWSLGRNHPECVWSVQLSLAVSYGRKASRWLIQFTLCPLVEERIWHDTKCHSIDAFPNKGQKKWLPRPLLSPFLLGLLLLVSVLTSTLNPSRLSYICQVHGLYLTRLPWFQLLYGAGHVFTVYMMGCWEKRGRTGVLVPFGATFKCLRLCVLYAIEGCVLFSGKCQGSRRPYGRMVLTTLTQL